jgi:DNA-binding GntR family transcriptional regulator
MVLVSSGTTVSELHEARAVLEPFMIQLLASERDESLLCELQDQLDVAKRHIDAEDCRGAPDCVNEFHAALVHASANRR